MTKCLMTDGTDKLAIILKSDSFFKTHVNVVLNVLNMSMFKFFNNMQKITPGNRIVSINATLI